MQTCIYCGVNLVLDKHQYVCPVCGIVYGPEYVCTPTQYVVTLSRTESEIRRYLREAESRFNLSDPEKKLLKELLRYKRYRLSYDELRRVVQSIRNSETYRDLSQARSRLVYEAIVRLVSDNNLSMDANSVFEFAARHRDLWSGRKPATVAAMFIYLYAKIFEKREIELQLSPHLKTAITYLEKTIREREGR